MTSKMSIAVAMAATVGLCASPAFAKMKIWAGADGGAYKDTFCPPLPAALAEANFPGYACAKSGGTLENITNVLADGSDVGFVQLDVFAREATTRPELKEKLTIIRSDIACEGMWMVTKNISYQNFGDILGGRRIPFVLPPEVSGSAASFKYLQTLDPDGLGRAKNITYTGSAKDVIERVAASQDKAVGYFVQWANPDNGNIQLMVEKGLNIVPVVSREIGNAKVEGQELYSVKTFNLTAGGLIASGKEATTACTPVALITGKPEAQKERDAQDDQKDLIKKLASVPTSKLLPAEGKLAALLKNIKSISGPALNDMMALVEKTKQAAIAAASN